MRRTISCAMPVTILKKALDRTGAPNFGTLLATTVPPRHQNWLGFRADPLATSRSASPRSLAQLTGVIAAEPAPPADSRDPPQKNHPILLKKLAEHLDSTLGSVDDSTRIGGGQAFSRECKPF
jgi:hypothetical protein